LGPWSWQQAAGEVEKILASKRSWQGNCVAPTAIRRDRPPSGSLTIELSAATPVV
jgi:hypothetical protein